MELQALALAAIRARAEYLDAVRKLAMKANPLGFTNEHFQKLEDAVDAIADDGTDTTCMEEIQAIVHVAQGTQH